VREVVNFKLLAVVMITGFLFSAGSSYFNQLVFADDPWSDIADRQQAAEQKAMEKYMNSYQFANTDQSKRNWDGLTSTATDETSRGRNLEMPQQVSLQNAVAEFDTIHFIQLANFTSDDYKKISSTQTDTQGRDRDDMLDNARASSLVQAQDVLSQLIKIQENYANFAPSTPTDSDATYDRQTEIEKNMNNDEAQAAALVSQLAKIDNVYIDLSQYVDTAIPYTYKSGSITNEMTHGGRNLTPQEAYSLEKAVMIFNEIHDKHLVALQSNYYGLTNTPTDTQGRDRGIMLEQARNVSLDHALRVYNAYYNGVGLK
jgi:hypothetical protein